VGFARSAASWNHGGVAFFDHTASEEVWGRAYLVTTSQFADIFAQENGLKPGDLDLSDTLSTTEPFVPSRVADESHPYRLIVPMTAYEGVPMLTFTHPRSRLLRRTRPGAAYLRTIYRGLREAYQEQSNAELVAYLAEASEASPSRVWRDTVARISAWQHSKRGAARVRCESRKNLQPPRRQARPMHASPAKVAT